MTVTVLSFVCLVTLAVIFTTFRYLGQRTGIAAAIILPVWLAYVGLLSYTGVVGDAERRPPGVALIVLPTILFIAVSLARGRLGARIATSVPVALLIGAQTFRIGVEVILHRAWQDGLAPRMLTYEGANFDIVIGVSAPIVAWAVWRGRLAARWAIVWNVAGLLMLANVIARSAMTAAGPFLAIQAEVPNLVVGTFPYTFIPGFFAPLAIALHVLAIRGLRSRRTAPMPSGCDRADAGRLAELR